MTEEEILELQEQNKKLLDEKAVLEDSLAKLNSEVERLRKINQKYYEKLIDTSVQEKTEVVEEKTNDYKTIDELTKSFLGGVN